MSSNVGLLRWVSHDGDCLAGGFGFHDCTCGLSEDICQCGHAFLATNYHAGDCPVKKVWNDAYRPVPAQEEEDADE